MVPVHNVFMANLLRQHQQRKKAKRKKKIPIQRRRVISFSNCLENLGKRDGGTSDCMSMCVCEKVLNRPCQNIETNCGETKGESNRKRQIDGEREWIWKVIVAFCVARYMDGCMCVWMHSNHNLCVEIFETLGHQITRTAPSHIINKTFWCIHRERETNTKQLEQILW